MIEAHAQTLRAARIDDFLQQIPIQDTTCVVVANLRVVQSKAIVVFARKDEILAARLLSNPGPFLSEARLLA